MYDSSGGDENSRRDEAVEILGIIQDSLTPDDLPEKEKIFVKDMIDKSERYGDKFRVSPKQLFWLRDIKDRCL